MPAIEVPDDVRVGEFADFARLWHTADSFVLDFCTMTDPAGNDSQGVARVVSRVRVPSAQAWELMRGLERQLTTWEQQKR